VWIANGDIVEIFTNNVIDCSRHDTESLGRNLFNIGRHVVLAETCRHFRLYYVAAWRAAAAMVYIKLGWIMGRRIINSPVLDKLPDEVNADPVELL